MEQISFNHIESVGSMLLKSNIGERKIILNLYYNVEQIIANKIPEIINNLQSKSLIEEKKVNLKKKYFLKIIYYK